MYEFLVLSLFAAISTIIGGLILIQLKFKKDKLSYFIAIAAGVLISVSFLTIIPEAIEISSYAGLGILTGFLIMYMIEQFGMVHSYIEFSENCKLHKISTFAFFGLLFHSFLDAVAIAAAPLFMLTCYSKRKILIVLLLVGLVTPLGAVNSLFLSLALGISAGTFVYIGCTDLIPHLHKRMNKKYFYCSWLGLY